MATDVSAGHADDLANGNSTAMLEIASEQPQADSIAAPVQTYGGGYTWEAVSSMPWACRLCLALNRHRCQTLRHLGLAVITVMQSRACFMSLIHLNMLEGS